MGQPATAALRIVAVSFVAAAAWILLAQLFGRLRGRRIWITYAVEVIVLALVLLPAFLGGRFLALVLAVIGVFCAHEILGALARAGERPDRAIGIVGLLAMLWATARFGLSGGYAAFALAAGVALARAVWPPAGTRGLSLGGSTLLALVYPGLFLAHLLALGESPSGFGDVFFCYALVEINDSLAYLVGASIGQSRPFPELSPNKTLAGCVGGVAGAVALSPALGFAVPDLDVAKVVGGAVLLAVAGLLGDLLASRIKREAGIKDFAARVPTHGGVLDLYDSLIFAAPFFYGYLTLCRTR